MTLEWSPVFIIMEIWKDIIWYEWIYQVSSLWEVKSLNYNRKWFEKILKPVKACWYLHIRLSNNWIVKSYKAHRLVAIAFIQNKDNKYQINHIDGNKLNNSVENLEWCTASENIQHAWNTWLAKITKNKYERHKSIKSVLQYDIQWNLLNKWESIIEASRNLWIDNSHISKACIWKNKTAGWFVWRYTF